MDLLVSQFSKTFSLIDISGLITVLGLMLYGLTGAGDDGGDGGGGDGGGGD